MDIITERLEWGDVENLDGVGEGSALSLDNEGVQLPEKRGQRLPGPRWCEDECVVTRCNCGPSLDLWRTRYADAFREPGTNQGMERRDRIRGGGHHRNLYAPIPHHARLCE